MAEKLGVSNKSVSRWVFYFSALVFEIGLLVSLSLTASPSDAMAVPLAGLLITSFRFLIERILS